MTRQSSPTLAFLNDAALLIAAAAMLLASACGGGGGGGSIQAPTPPPPTSNNLQSNQPPADDDDTTPADDFKIAGAKIDRIEIPVATAGGSIDFEEDFEAGVRGRVELVKELERCVGAASCSGARNWLFLGEWDQITAKQNFLEHRRLVSLAIQIGAGADPTRDYYPAVITNINTQNAFFINQAIRDGTIPKDSWINYSRSSTFADTPFATRGGNFDTPLLIRSSVVVAVAVGNEGTAKPYTQIYTNPAITPQHVDTWVNNAIDNTAAIFVYGLNQDSSDIDPASSRCGTVVMRACIGVSYLYLSPVEGAPDPRLRSLHYGTSFSVAMLSGAAWTMKSLWPHLTSRQIAAIMLETARELRGGVNEYTGVGALDFEALFKPVGPLAGTLGDDDQTLERGFLHLPGLTDFDNPEGVDKFARSFQLATSTVAIQPGFADFDLDRFTSVAPGSRLQLAVNKQAGSIEDAALAFGHTNKLVLSSRYIGLCRDGQSTDLCLTTTRREDFFGGQGSGSFRLDDTTYTSLAATHQMPIRERLKLGFSAAVTDARTSGRQLVGEVAGRLVQAEISLRSDTDARSRRTSASMSIWTSKFDGSMELLGRKSQLVGRDTGVRVHWRIDF